MISQPVDEIQNRHQAEEKPNESIHEEVYELPADQKSGEDSFNISHGLKTGEPGKAETGVLRQGSR